MYCTEIIQFTYFYASISVAFNHLPVQFLQFLSDWEIITFCLLSSARNYHSNIFFLHNFVFQCLIGLGSQWHCLARICQQYWNIKLEFLTNNNNSSNAFYPSSSNYPHNYQHNELCAEYFAGTNEPSKLGPAPRPNYHLYRIM